MNRRGWIVALAMIIAIGTAIHLKYINEFPAFIHAWAQADWYAIAVGFVENDLDFFHPQSFIYNKQFPDNWASSSSTTITSIDFPIQCYLVACWMKLFGTTSPWVFRVWSLLIGILGMYGLYRLCQLLTNNWLKSIFVTGLAMTTPTYAYYFAGFLPCVHAFAFAATGLWLYFDYVYHKRLWAFHAGLVLMGIALLMRTSFAIAFIALLCFELLRIWRKESTFWNKVPSVAIMAGIYVAWHLWNNHLRAANGSLFLNELRPPHTIEDAIEVFRNMRERWMYDYFTRMQHGVVAILAVMALIALVFRTMNKHLKTPKWIQQRLADNTHSAHTLSPWWFVVIYCFGSLLFVAAMMLQFTDHDYYFIDSLLLPVLLVIALLLDQLPVCRHCWTRIVCMAAVVCLLWTMTNDAKKKLHDRRDPNDRAYVCAQHYTGSNLFFDQLGIPKEAKILALFAYPQNSPFLLMERKGYIVMWYDEEIIENAVNSDHDYIVIENERYYGEWKNQCRYLCHLRPIASNGNITLCSWSDDPLPRWDSDTINCTSNYCSTRRISSASPIL